VCVCSVVACLYQEWRSLTTEARCVTNDKKVNRFGISKYRILNIKFLYFIILCTSNPIPTSLASMEIF